MHNNFKLYLKHFENLTNLCNRYNYSFTFRVSITLVLYIWKVYRQKRLPEWTGKYYFYTFKLFNAIMDTD